MNEIIGNFILRMMGVFMLSIGSLWTWVGHKRSNKLLGNRSKWEVLAFGHGSADEAIPKV